MTTTSPRPAGPAERGRRRLLIVLAVAGAAALAAAAVGGWYLFVRDDSPPPLTLGSQQAAPPAVSDFAGTWTVAPGSVVRYRVSEVFAGVSASTEAVGETSAVTGSATLEEDGDRVRATAARFEADLTTLKSDRSRRDEAIRTRGLETSRFPTATFVLAEPVAVPKAGGSVDAVGDLTLHGVTRRVTIPLDTRVNGRQVELAGSLTFPFAQFEMRPPSIGGFVEVEEEATLELRLVLARA